MSQVATCIGCGCTDHHACPGGCWWLVVDYEARRGVCSECPDQVKRWNANDRTIKVPMLVAKIIKEGETEPYYIEANAMDIFPTVLDTTVGTKYSIEWIAMTSDQFEALPQFQHVRDAKKWGELMAAAEDARRGGKPKVQKQRLSEAREIAEAVAKQGYDVRELHTQFVAEAEPGFA